MSEQAQEAMNLQVPDDGAIKEELSILADQQIEKIDPELEQKAASYVDQLLDPNIDETIKRRAVDEMGLRTQTEAAQMSRMLDEPIRSLAKAGDSGGPVAEALVNLREEVEELDPTGLDFSTAPGFLASLARLIPGVGDNLSRYFSKYMTSEAVINEIIQSLEKGSDQLKRDSVTLGNDKKRMLMLMERMTKTIQLGKLIDQKLEYKLSRDVDPSSPDYRFIQEELLFPIRQRIVDLQQSLNVNQQGVLTIEIIIRNNRELIRGVNRASTVTVQALQIAVASALALNNQEIVLKKINALNDTTSKLIRHNAERLKTQGAAIHKQASSSALNMDDLEAAFADIKAAIDDISTFRQEALPKMANNILRMDELNKVAQAEIDKFEKGNKMQTGIMIDLDASDVKL